uniref:Transposase n=1 Tax=Panagrellus redivivus TaxID=6233 RepID=A0A7E4UXE1_PANRE
MVELFRRSSRMTKDYGVEFIGKRETMAIAECVGKKQRCVLSKCTGHAKQLADAICTIEAALIQRYSYTTGTT